MPTVKLTLDADATVTGYWSDGTANVELAASLRNTGDLRTEGSHSVAVTCWRAGEAIDGCGSELSISLSDGFGPTAKAVTLRVPMGEVSFRFDYGGDEPTTLEIDVPERILGVDRDVWACFSDTSHVGTAMQGEEGVGCAGWFSETIRKWDQTSPVKVWAAGPQSFVSKFYDVLGYLSPLLGLAFERVPTESEAALVAHIGYTREEADELRVSCSYGTLGCASSDPNELGEVKRARMAVHNHSDLGPEFEDIGSRWQRVVVNAIVHEAVHALGSIRHRSEPDSVMNNRTFLRTAPSPMEEALLRLHGHPLVAPGMTIEEIERLIVFSDELIEPEEDVDLTKWKLVTNAYKVLREAGSAEFRVRSSFSACDMTFGWADYAISDLAREYRHGHAGWTMVNDGSDHFYYIRHSGLGVNEYWRRSNDAWTLSSHQRYADATSGWRSALSDPHSMMVNVLHYTDWTDAKLEIDPGGLATLRFELNTVEHGRLDVVIVLDPGTYVISKYSMDWELADDTCGGYRVEAKDGRYHDEFELPRTLRDSSDIFDACNIEPLGPISRTISLAGTWTKHCGNDRKIEGYARSYGFSVADWSNVRIELSSNDPTSLRLRRSGRSANVSVDQGVFVRFSTDFEFIWARWAQGVVPAGHYIVEAVTLDGLLPGTFGLSISTSRTHEPPHSFKAISSGARHTCALDSDGSAVCWGSIGALHAWPPWGEISIVATSGEKFIDISSGTFHSCGLKHNGSAVCWGANYAGEISPPQGEWFVSISSGGGHVCALREDGSAACWGSNYDGETSPPKGERFVSISSGARHTCALREDGSPVCWGLTTEPPNGERFVSISSGRMHACALRHDGSAVCWGEDSYGEASPPPAERFRSISSGGWHTCALREDGTPVCWGDYRNGQTSPPAGERFTAISSGSRHTCGLRFDGSPVCWGSNEYGQMAPTSLESRPVEVDSTPTPVPAKFVSIASGRFHACALRSDATPVCWGRNYYGGQAFPPPRERFTSASSGAFHTCGIREDGSPVCWGSDSRNQSSWPIWTSVTGLKSISSGGFHTCGLRADFTVECWSLGSFGQVSPPRGRFLSVSSGGFHTCGLREDGAPVCWGHDGFGQSSAPAGERFASISSGMKHTCGLRQDGSAVCWGADEDAIDFGQASPPTDERFASISSGVWHTCGLRSDGSAVCWGGDEYGQASAPSDQRFAAISSGMKHTCAITLGGIVVCWGSNEYGQTTPPTH